ncbi:MAG: tetratricopeptide repeat protein, partial [Conchiformibius sp.]|nr:tetratricopeptide repeat protein [Conchiformibius sp.]
AQDDEQAVAWFRKAAEQGMADAQFNLGMMYEHGEGVAQDDEQAVAWFRKAAEQGNALGQTSLGVMYEFGKGVAQDREQAVRLYRQAAQQDYDKEVKKIAQDALKRLQAE